jgi:hypothetical protein
MRSKKVIDNIVNDLSIIWGEMALFMVNKRLADVGANPEDITEKQMEDMIELLREKTLEMTLGPVKAGQKAILYRKWLQDPDN